MAGSGGPHLPRQRPDSLDQVLQGLLSFVWKFGAAIILFGVGAVLFVALVVWLVR